MDGRTNTKALKRQRYKDYQAFVGSEAETLSRDDWFLLVQLNIPDYNFTDRLKTEHAQKLKTFEVPDDADPSWWRYKTIDYYGLEIMEERRKAHPPKTPRQKATYTKFAAYKEKGGRLGWEGYNEMIREENRKANHPKFAEYKEKGGRLDWEAYNQMVKPPGSGNWHDDIKTTWVDRLLQDHKEGKLDFDISGKESSSWFWDKARETYLVEIDNDLLQRMKETKESDGGDGLETSRYNHKAAQNLARRKTGTDTDDEDSDSTTSPKQARKRDRNRNSSDDEESGFRPNPSKRPRVSSTVPDDADDQPRHESKRPTTTHTTAIQEKIEWRLNQTRISAKAKHEHPWGQRSPSPERTQLSDDEHLAPGVTQVHDAQQNRWDFEPFPIGNDSLAYPPDTQPEAAKNRPKTGSTPTQATADESGPSIVEVFEALNADGIDDIRRKTKNMVNASDEGLTRLAKEWFPQSTETVERDEILSALDSDDLMAFRSNLKDVVVKSTEGRACVVDEWFSEANKEKSSKRASGKTSNEAVRKDPYKRTRASAAEGLRDG